MRFTHWSGEQHSCEALGSELALERVRDGQTIPFPNSSQLNLDHPVKLPMMCTLLTQLVMD